MEDLWCFNDERVARAIYDCEIPVISAVGHEPDVTIADFVADLRAATPSNAAELAAPDMAELIQAIDTANARLARAAGKKLSRSREALDALAQRRVIQSPTGFIAERRLRLDTLRGRLAACGGFVDKERGRLDALAVRLNAAADASAARSKGALAALAAKLDAMSPLKVLSRGYAIAMDEQGRALKDAGKIKTGARLTVRLERGSVGCRVEDTYGE